ncbi:MAG: LysR family transcriptional regulator ArgP [Paracoccus sp. (in: a-proteobacteria)]|nr:LysR family transcriptional regulator ArgP [Paracoccus sp. (in: a-proteobacteria)]
MMDYPALAALTEIIRRGSFEAAAAALNVTPSAVSQRIRALEDRMGAVLIHRGPPATGTEAGLRLMRHADQVRLLEQGLAAEMGRDTAPAHLRIAVNADSLATWFPEAMAPDGLLFDLVLDDQDHAGEWLRQGRVSAAISADPQPVAGCDSVALGVMRYHALATPGFVARHFGAGVSAAALLRAPAVVFNLKDRLQARWARAATGTRVAPTGHFIPSAEAFARAVEAGLGWGMIPEAMVPRALQTGALVPLRADLPLDVALYWQSPRVMAQALAPLARAVRQAAARHLRPVE